MGIDGTKWLTDKEWSETADKMRKSGKVRYLGFSTHTRPIETRIALLAAAAAKGSWVDAIMVATNPTVMRSNKAFNDALTACHKAGVGLVSMKESFTGSDTIEGRAHRDVLWGEAGDDLLYGGTWPDVLDGGDGTDTLDGGRGIDACTAGETLTACEL